jgi:hypothetical protein
MTLLSQNMTLLGLYSGRRKDTVSEGSHWLGSMPMQSTAHGDMEASDALRMMLGRPYIREKVMDGFLGMAYGCLCGSRSIRLMDVQESNAKPLGLLPTKPAFRWSALWHYLPDCEKVQFCSEEGATFVLNEPAGAERGEILTGESTDG